MGYIKKLFMMYKITANIVCKNEKYWIKESILSIYTYVDEIVYVDDMSDDGTLEIVENLSKNYSNIKIFRYEYHKLTNLGDLKNFALSKSKNDFVIRWDADFIAYDDIKELFEFCIENNSIYDGYILSGPNLSGDINHQPLVKDFFGPECYLFRKSEMKFQANQRYPDYPVFSKGFRYCYPKNTKLSKDFFFLHTNSLKSIERITFRKRMCDYHIDRTNNSYWDWLSITTDQKDIKKVEIEKTLNTNIDVKEFDYEKWGNHPKILLDSESSSLFSIKKIKDKYYLDKYPIT